MKWWMWACLGAGVALAGLAREEIGLLLIGWVLFLRRTLCQVTINPSAVATGAVAVALLVCAIHYFGRSCRGAASDAADTSRPRWRFRWTLIVMLAVFVMFAAGFAAVGLARHVGWLFSSQRPSYVAVDSRSIE